MSYKAASWAADQRGIGPYAKVLLQQLADRHNPDDGCFPSQETLARDCEFSRSTINEQLRKLEAAGLVKRVSSRHPVTHKQMPTRYFLAFEDGFAEIAGTANGDDDSTESRVREPDTEIDPSRVRASTEAESGSAPEPSPPARTLTSNLTSKGTSKRAGARDRVSLFEEIWKTFPMRPGSSRDVAWEMFIKLDDTEAPAALKGAQRFAAWFRENEPGKPLEERLRYVKYLSRWLHERGWIGAMKLPVAFVPGSEAAAAMEGFEDVNKWSQPALFAACEQVRGRSVPVGKSGSWSFPKDVVAAARERCGIGPPT